MRAAVVTSFTQPPRCLEWAEPVGVPGAMVVDLIAAGLHPRVRSQAAGTHYTSTEELPLVPGIDGVGRDADGALRYFILPDTRAGSMSERVLINPRRSIVLPEGADPIAVAAGMNPAMSSWIALGRRLTLPSKAGVLVIGATGNAGLMALQVARHLGASQVFGVARDPAKLPLITALGATPLTFAAGDITRAAVVDIVLDYVWGEASAQVMIDLISARQDRGQPFTWITIGSVGGMTAPIPSAALRASGLTIIGSGQGSVSTDDILAELPAIATALTDGTLTLKTRTAQLSDVEHHWGATMSTSERMVIIP